MKKIFLLSVLCVISTMALAEGRYSIKEMTPELEQALEGRKERFEQLSDLKSKGVVGENNHGYAEILKSENDANVLVEAENRDRKVIYEGIAGQNGLGNALSVIESVFAQVQRDKAKSGEHVQTDNGEWIEK